MLSEQIRYVDDAISSRHSVRAFLNTPVKKQDVLDILSVASRAPSGSNTQPWKVYVVTGDTRQKMIDRVCQAQIGLFNNPALADQYSETFTYYPETWISPFIDRRRENGWGLYGLLGIQKGEKKKWQRNNCVIISCLMHLLPCILRSIKPWASVQKWTFP